MFLFTDERIITTARCSPLIDLFDVVTIAPAFHHKCIDSNEPSKEPQMWKIVDQRPIGCGSQ